MSASPATSQVGKGGLPPLFAFCSKKQEQKRGQATLPNLRDFVPSQFLGRCEPPSEFLCKADSKRSTPKQLTGVELLVLAGVRVRILR
jgi:hypothetical protein